MLGKLAELESQIRELSHDQTAIQIIQSFAIDLGNTKQRQIIFGSDGALLRDPFFYQDALEKGLLDEKEDPFNLLQGDIVSTDAAYFFGERLEGMKFAIANSTCDLVPIDVGILNVNKKRTKKIKKSTCFTSTIEKT